MTLHLILVLLFQQKTNTIIHVPGKFVPTMISYLSDHVPKKEHGKLVECQQLISDKWKSSITCEDESTTKNDDSLGSTPYTTTDKETSIQTLIQELKHLVL